MASSAANTLIGHYDQYFATQQQLAWYELMAVDKSRNVMEICRDVPHDSILDVGAGSGAVLRKLDEADFGTKLFAVDISPSGLQALRATAWKHLVEAREFDGYRIPYADDAFDLAILSHVVEHVEHPRLLLREAARVAKHLYIEVPLEFNRSNRRMKRDFKLDATGHINFYSPDLIRLLVQTCGLLVLRQEARHFSPSAYTFHGSKRRLINYWIKELMLRMAPHWALALFNYHCGILCAKTTPQAKTDPNPS
jgi:ubiquinone/menaquinone biosynthesis C-methylase UbiE